MRKLYLLRHGLTEANRQGLYCGSTDLPLSERGLAALETLRQAGGYPSLEGLRVYVSALRRTRETLFALYGETDCTALPALNEMDFGVFEMKGYETLQNDPAYRRWCDGDNETNTAPGGESGQTMTTRVLEALDELLTLPGDLLLVLHGGPMAAIMSRFFPGESKSRYAWQRENGRGWAVLLEKNAAVRYDALPVVRK